MAGTASIQPGIIKEGYLAQGLDRIPSVFKSKSKLWCELLKQDQTGILNCYKDDTKTKLNQRIIVTGAEIEFDRSEHGNYLCIKRGKQVTYLHAENRQQRDEWYWTIKNLLDPQGIDQNGGFMRSRSGTDALSNRPPIGRGRKRNEPQTTDSAVTSFNHAMKETTSSDLPPPPPQRKESLADSDGDIAKVREPYCCMRNHVVLDNTTGANVVHIKEHYENIHFIESQEKWIVEVEKRKGILGKTSHLYSDLNAVVYMQRKNENTYDTVVSRRAVEQDERECLPSSRRDRPLQPPVTSKPKADVGDSRRISRETEKDISEAERNFLDQRPPLPPPVPIPTKQALAKKIALTQEEQSQVHGISKTFQKSALVGGKIRLKEMKDGIWIIALNKSERQLKGALKIGDQLIKINRQRLSSASYAQETINNTDDNEVTLVIKRIPHGTICTVTRQNPNDDIGIRVDGNEIQCVEPRGMLGRQGGLKPQTTGINGRLCNWAITEINTQPVDPFASTLEIKELLRQAKEDVALIVQPVDFIQMMRDTLTDLKKKGIL